MQTLRNMPLSDIAYYHIGGRAESLIEVTKKEDLLKTLQHVLQEKMKPVYILGLGANLLIPDTGLSGAVILLQSGKEDFKVTKNAQITAFAGGTFDSLIKFSFSQHLVGLGWAGGLPSSVGGAVRGNVGAFGHEIKDDILSVDVIDMTDPSLKIQTFSNADCQFAYRDSFFKHNKNLIIVSAIFQFVSATSEQLQQDESIYQKNITYRNTHHPMDYPSCGSVFKNIVVEEKIEKVLHVWPDIRDLVHEKWYGKVSMAYVIGRLGFNGLKIGNAQVSEKHNNYISNLGNARASDVKEIILKIKEKFVQTFGFEPELEVEVVK